MSSGLKNDRESQRESRRAKCLQDVELQHLVGIQVVDKAVRGVVAIGKIQVFAIFRHRVAVPLRNVGSRGVL
jgi:hypothetical protein